MAGEVRVVMDPVKLAEVLRGPRGPVMRELLEVGYEIKRQAQREAPVARPDPYTLAHRDRRPGTLRDSVVTRVRSVAGNPSVEVGSDDPVALWTHEGTVPHEIRPRKAQRLVFFWAKVGKVVALPRVHHPGTQPNRWLLRARDTVFRRRY